MTATHAPTRSDIIRSFIPASPLVGHLGMRLQHLEADRAVLVLPFDPSIATFGDVVHGGAISALADTAAMAAAWASDEVPETQTGATISLAVDFLAAARGSDLTARAQVLRRGRRLCFVRVDVGDAEGRLVATAQVTYQLGA